MLKRDRSQTSMGHWFYFSDLDFKGQSSMCFEALHRLGPFCDVIAKLCQDAKFTILNILLHVVFTFLCTIVIFEVLLKYLLFSNEYYEQFRVREW